MKLKILLVPSLMLLIAYLFIANVVPLYFGAEGVDVARTNLAAANVKLDDIIIKSDNAVKLASELNRSTEQQAVVGQYLPEKKGEDDIINTLNSIASNKHVLMNNISVGEVSKNETATQVAAPVDMGIGNGIENVAVSADGLVKKFNVAIEISGSYADIRSFIVALNSLKRFNNISELNIARNAGEDKNSLVAKITTSFNYLDKITSAANVDKKIFDNAEFDMSVVNKIKDKATLDISKTKAGSVGRSNLFAL